MSTALLSDQHNEWHLVNGRYSTCPLDCGAGEAVSQFFEIDAERVCDSGVRGIKCGSCQGYHFDIAAVKFCFVVKYDSEKFERTQVAMAAAIEAKGECEHGLSQALCSGPGHYPAD